MSLERCNQTPKGCVSFAVISATALREMAEAGDEAAFAALLQPLLEPALRLSYAMLGNRPDAEDATQEAVTRAWRKLGQLRPGAPVRPWFLAIVANQCRSLRRSPWFRITRVAEVFREDPWQDPTVSLDLQRALAKLSSTDRQALFMRYYLDLPVEEVAQALGVTPNAAKVRIHRACARLKPGLREEEL